MGTTQTTDKKNVAQQKPVSIGVTPNKMHVFVNIRVPQEDINACADTIQKALTKFDIGNKLSHDKILDWISITVDPEGLIKNGILYTGTPALQPVDEKIKWADDFFSTGFKVDPETGSLDYRQHTGRSTVAEGEHLATIIPGEPGLDGKNVFGEKIPALKLKTAKLGEKSKPVIQHTHIKVGSPRTV